jgi:thiamine-phosphate pyrophosphorylase
MNARLRGLYAIADTHYLAPDRLLAAVAEAIEGGARVVQLRDKSDDTRARARLVLELAALCRARNVTCIVNDDLRLAIRADGVHLGREDPPPAQARVALGSGKLVGVSCYNEIERALAAAQQGADYVAFGSFFPSRTKPQAVRASPELLRAAKRRLRIPVVAIGGITPENGAELIEAGADMLAVIEGVFGQPDIRAAAERYTRLFEDTDR